MKTSTQALELNRKINNQVASVINLNNIGDIYQKQGDYHSALEYSFQSLALARQLNQKYQVRSAYRDISQTYAFLNDHGRSYNYLDSAYLIYGEIYNLETARQIAQMQIVYETQEKDNEIALLEANKRFNRLLIAVFAGALVIITGLGLLIVSRQRLLIIKNKRSSNKTKRIYEAEKGTAPGCSREYAAQ
ncbi:MAG: tetratricopeptide repeat protein [Leadbetterella sp.]|nr:tetratricopeptide repeat protein [Leadbetterella sp.]